MVIYMFTCAVSINQKFIFFLLHTGSFAILGLLHGKIIHKTKHDLCGTKEMLIACYISILFVSTYQIQLQADLQRLVRVTGVVTQGRQDKDTWVRNFVVYHSSDCLQWSAIKGRGGAEKVQYSL